MCVCEWEKRRCLRISFYYLIIHLIIIFVFWCTKPPLVTWTKGLNHKIVTCLSVCLLNRLGYFFFFGKSFFLPLSLSFYMCCVHVGVCVWQREKGRDKERVCIRVVRECLSTTLTINTGVAADTRTVVHPAVCHRNTFLSTSRCGQRLS